MGADQGPPDGDELGHVGAAALFVYDLREGAPGAWLWRAWAGDTGEYPGLYPAILSLPWALFGLGHPSRLPLGALNLGLALLTAGAAGRVARRLVAPERATLAELGAFGACLLLPEGTGISRHFMPEGALAAAVALTLLLALRAVKRPTRGRAAALGLALGLGMLTKQTLALYALAPVAWTLLRLRGRGLWTLGVAAAVAGPWYALHLGAQLAYGAGSAPADASVPLTLHLAYYPLALGWSGLGPALALALVLTLARRPAGLALPLGTLGLGLLLLTLVPKKYPRLLVPLGPAAAVVLGVGLAGSRRPALGAWGWGGAAAAWTTLGSLHDLPPPSPITEMASGCVQRWLRPPLADAMGLPEVVAASRADPRPLLVIGAPEIPCEVQTTLPWLEHLRPWLEQEGLDRVVLEPADAQAGSAGLIVDWGGGPGEEVPVPALGRSLWIRVIPPAQAPW